MKHLIITVLCLGFSSGILAQEGKVWSLKDCMNYAIENNIQIKQQALSLEDAELNRKDAFGNLLPNLTANVTNDWNRGFSQGANGVFGERNTRQSSYSVRSGIPIFNGFRSYKTYQRTKLQEVVAQYGLESLKDDIRLNIANSYVQVLLNKENVKVLEAQNQLTQQQLEQTANFIEAGTLPQGDILEIKSQNAQEMQQIIDAKNTLQLSKLSLKQLLNLNSSDAMNVIDVDDVIFDESYLNLPVEKILEQVLTTRNEVIRGQKNVEIQEENIDIAKARFYPNVTGNVSYGTSEITVEQDGVDVDVPSYLDQLDNRRRFAFGVNMNVPIFNRNQTKNAVSRAKVSKMRSEFELELTKQRLTQNVYQAYLDAKASQKSYEAAQVSLDAQKTAFEYAKNRFEAGVSNAFEFNQVKLRLLNREIGLVRSKYDLVFRLKLLELYYTGKVSEN